MKLECHRLECMFPISFGKTASCPHVPLVKSCCGIYRFDSPALFLYFILSTPKTFVCKCVCVCVHTCCFNVQIYLLWWHLMSWLLQKSPSFFILYAWMTQILITVNMYECWSMVTEMTRSPLWPSSNTICYLVYLSPIASPAGDQNTV